MEHSKKVLVLGATGAMGQYLVPRLADMGYRVDGVSLDAAESTHSNVKFIKANAKDYSVLNGLLNAKYDAIVDFMIYSTEEISRYLPRFQEKNHHYIFLSSYRIYDNKEHPIRETSPRLLDSSENTLLRNSDDYSIYKARGENVIRAFPAKNWTIIRPAITYSRLRYQLVTLEAQNTVGRARTGKIAVLPQQAKDVQATMSWAGDVARMIAELLFNEKAFGETFTVATAEHQSWGRIAEYYHEICGLKSIWVDKEDYLKILDPDPFRPGARWQLEYDRLFERIIDNSKILAATGMKQKELTSLYDGLEKEIARCPKDFISLQNTRMDDYIAAIR